MESGDVIKGCGGLIVALIIAGLLAAGVSVATIQRWLDRIAPPSERTRRVEPPGGDAAGFEPPDVPLERRGNRTIESFRAAKRHIYRIHAEAGREQTFYCGCDYADRRPQLSGCGYEVRAREKRAGRTEVEHVVPASRFGHAFEAWKQGDPACETSEGRTYKGRRCARRASAEFERMEADLHNLQPTIGEVNADRLNYAVGIIDGEAREYGACDVEIVDERIEPRPAVRGDIARTYLYMAWAYPKRMELEAQERALLERWDREDPVDDWERARAREIESIQGNPNPFVSR